MIRLVLFNLASILTQDGRVYPHVRESLEAISIFETADHSSLERCLVVNRELAVVSSSAHIETMWGDAVLRLNQLGLIQFFEPVERRVTLACHAGVPIPDKSIFLTAIHRLAVEVRLSECLFITHDDIHVAACRSLGMRALRFDCSDSTADFNDWSEAPLIIVGMVARDSRNNLKAALGVRLAVTDGLELTDINQQIPDGSLQLRAKKWYPLYGSALGKLRGIRVRLPTRAEVVVHNGRIETVKTTAPSDDELAEAASFVESLIATGQIAVDEHAAPRTTHQVEVDPQGRRYLRRKRFTSLSTG